MRLALPGSALVHAGALGLLLIGFAWPESGDAPAPASVSVLVVPVTTVTGNASETVASDSTVSAVSAGSEAVPVVPVEQPAVEPLAQTAAPLSPDVIEPVRPDDVAPAEPAEANDMAELSSTAAAALEIEALQPNPAEVAPVVAPASTLKPVASEDLARAPVPQMASIARQSAPIVHAPRRAEPAPAKPASAGNGGRDSADSVAATAPAAPRASGEGAGGSGDVARYPGQVVSKLRAALRRAGGQRGEVVVRFTVSADGRVSGLVVARSSGSGAVDEAGLAIVRRAAPFPPIPPAAGRSDWTFDVPLAFGG